MQFSTRKLLVVVAPMMALHLLLPSITHGDLIGLWPFDEIVEIDGERWTPDVAPDGGHDGLVLGPAELVDDPDRGLVMDFGEFNNNAVVELPSFPQNEEAAGGVSEDLGPGFNAIIDSQEVTIAFWFNRGGDDATDQWTFLFDADSGRQLGSHAPWSNGEIYFDVAGCCGSNQRINASMNGADTDRIWHHLAYVKKSNRDESEKSVTAIFQDGVPIASSPGCDLVCWLDGADDVDWRNATIDDVAPILTAAIGAESGGGNSQSGMIDDFAIWDEALSTDRIAAIAQGGPLLPIIDVPTLGDFNDDGAVDALDFLIITENLNEQFTLQDAFFSGDMDGNLRVDLKDFLLFRALIDPHVLLATVPAPSGLHLSGIALAMLAVIGRRR